MKSHGRFLWVAGLMAVSALIAAACGGGGGGSTPTAGAGTTAGPAATTAGGVPSDAAPDSQQVLTWNVGAEPSSIDPQAQSYTYEYSVVHNLYMSLFDQDPKTSKLIPWAASEMPTTQNGGIASDGVTYTIKLKSGLTWSDGSPLTASDFVYGIIRGFDLNVSGNGYGGFITNIKGADVASALDPKSATYVQDVQNAFKDSIVAVDPTTVKLVALKQSASFLSNFTLPITAAVKKDNVEALGANFGQASGAAQMITSGPFTVKEWVPKDHVTLQRNNNFPSVVGHKAFLSQVKYTVIEDANQAYNAYQSGQADEAAVPPALYPQVSGDSAQKQLIKQEEEFGTRWMSVDVTIPPWNNKDFVIAINQATDREAIARDVYKGIRKAWTAPCASAVVACDPSKFSNLDFNLDKAKASLQTAYPDGNIAPITIETVSDPTTVAAANTLQQQWQQLPGVKVNIKTTDQKTLRADMKNHVSGTQITGWAMDFADPTDLWSIWTSSQIPGNNLGFYSRADYDKLVTQEDAALDSSQRSQVLGQIQDFLAADPPVVQMFIQLRTDIFKDYVKGMITSPFNGQIYGDQNLSEVYIAKH